VRDFVRFHGRRHPREMGGPEVEAYLTMLANRRRVAASTHNQALSALLFLYRAVLKVELPWLDDIQRPRRPQRLPVILSVEEVNAVLSRMQGDYGLLARLLYGTGMRINEALRLRVKDVDFDRLTLVVREGKGNEDRVDERFARSSPPVVRAALQRFPATAPPPFPSAAARSSSSAEYACRAAARASMCEATGSVMTSSTRIASTRQVQPASPA
jgi:integrase